MACKFYIGPTQWSCRRCSALAFTWVQILLLPVSRTWLDQTHCYSHQAQASDLADFHLSKVSPSPSLSSSVCVWFVTFVVFTTKVGCFDVGILSVLNDVVYRHQQIRDVLLVVLVQGIKAHETEVFDESADGCCQTSVLLTPLWVLGVFQKTYRIGLEKSVIEMLAS